jgi:hypothetical protein
VGLLGPCPSAGGGRKGMLGWGYPCSWLMLGSYLSFPQVIGDKPDKHWPGARVGQGRGDGDCKFGVRGQWHLKGFRWQTEQAAYPHRG